MTIIRATCVICGDVELTQDDVTLTVVYPVSERSTYSFTCPACGEETSKAATDEVVALLMSGGVHVQQVIIPAEALEPHTGPPLTMDDLLDLMLDTSSQDAPGGLRKGP